MKAKTKFYILFAMIFGYGCGGNDSVDPNMELRSETKIIFTSGFDQFGFINEALIDSLEIIVLDSADSPIVGLQLKISGDGNLTTSNNTISDESGKIKVKWTLGNRYFNTMTVKFDGDNHYKEASIFTELKAIYRKPCD